jgi:hypothetical protein
MTVMTRRAGWPNIGLRSPTSATDVSTLTTPDAFCVPASGAAAPAASGTTR